MWLFGSRTSTPSVPEPTTEVESPSPSPSRSPPQTQTPSGSSPSKSTISAVPETLQTVETESDDSVENSSLLHLATAATSHLKEDGPAFLKVRKLLSVDVDTCRYIDKLQDIATNPDFLLRKVTDVSDMNDEEFGRTRDLVCVVLSHLQGRVVTANGFCKTGRTDYVTSWRGKCQAAGTAGKNALTPGKSRKTVKCRCNFSFHLNRVGQVFLKGEHTCPEIDRHTISGSNKLLAYTLSSSEMQHLLDSCVQMLNENHDLKRRDIENFVDSELRKKEILSIHVTSGSFARVLYTQARARMEGSSTSVVSAVRKEAKKEKAKVAPKEKNTIIASVPSPSSAITNENGSSKGAYSDSLVVPKKTAKGTTSKSTDLEKKQKQSKVTAAKRTTTSTSTSESNAAASEDTTATAATAGAAVDGPVINLSVAATKKRAHDDPKTSTEKKKRARKEKQSASATENADITSESTPADSSSNSCSSSTTTIGTTEPTSTKKTKKIATGKTKTMAPSVSLPTETAPSSPVTSPVAKTKKTISYVKKVASKAKLPTKATGTKNKTKVNIKAKSLATVAASSAITPTAVAKEKKRGAGSGAGAAHKNISVAEEEVETSRVPLKKRKVQKL